MAPADCVGIKTDTISGSPDSAHISTSYAEQAYLTMRMHMRRFTQLANAFSKKIENHAHSLALFTTYYNFVRIDMTLRVTPAMAPGLTDRLWEVADIVSLLEAVEPKPASAGRMSRAKGRPHDLGPTYYRSLHSDHSRGHLAGLPR